MKNLISGKVMHLLTLIKKRILASGGRSLCLFALDGRQGIAYVKQQSLRAVGTNP